MKYCPSNIFDKQAQQTNTLLCIAKTLLCFDNYLLDCQHDAKTYTYVYSEYPANCYHIILLSSTLRETWQSLPHQPLLAPLTPLLPPPSSPLPRLPLRQHLVSATTTASPFLVDCYCCLFLSPLPAPQLPVVCRCLATVTPTATAAPVPSANAAASFSNASPLHPK